MRVLMMESVPGAGRALSDHLEAGGDDVARCFPGGGPALGCQAMVPGSACPLDAGTVDVAVAVGPAASGAGEVAAGHAGARCALIHHVPLVVCDPKGDSALAPWATRSCAEGDTEAADDALRQAAAVPLAREADEARAAVRHVLEVRGLDPSVADVTVRRQGPGLSVRIDAGPDTDQATAEVAAVRALEAVRRVATRSHHIDVGLAADG
jgi:hypothetical protein